MSEQAVNTKRRKVLTLATGAVAAVGAGFLSVPFAKSWLPSERAKNFGAPVEADISKLEAGQLLRVEWQGKPVWILHRTEEMLSNLKVVAETIRLTDPDSTRFPQQPAYATNDHRSVRPEILILVGICTHLGCSPTFRPEIAPADLGGRWKGGFFCPCHGSRFDLAGRVFDGDPAPKNLEVPKHSFLSETIVLIGAEKGGA